MKNTRLLRAGTLAALTLWAMTSAAFAQDEGARRAAEESRAREEARKTEEAKVPEMAVAQRNAKPDAFKANGGFEDAKALGERLKAEGVTDPRHVSRADAGGLSPKSTPVAKPDASGAPKMAKAPGR